MTCALFPYIFEELTENYRNQGKKSEKKKKESIVIRINM